MASAATRIDALIARFDDSTVARLNGLHVFIAHQSVGGDIVEGIEAWRQRMPVIRLRVTRSQSLHLPDGPVLAHDYIGDNGNPEGKTIAFARVMRDAADSGAWIGVSKYCYADFGRDTDPQRVFDDYVRQVEALQREHSGVRLVHVTTPLMTLEHPVKDLARRLLGRTRVVDRMRRVQEYNDLLRRHFAASKTVFDLAAVESRGLRGQLTTIRDGGRALQALAPEFTVDGGHLNGVGREVVAGEMLLFLSELAAR